MVAKEDLMPAEVAAGNLWLPAVAEFATNESLPSWFPWSRQQMTWYHMDDMDWGHVSTMRPGRAECAAFVGKWMPLIIPAVAGRPGERLVDQGRRERPVTLSVRAGWGG